MIVFPKIYYLTILEKRNYVTLFLGHHKNKMVIFKVATIYTALKRSKDNQ